MSRAQQPLAVRWSTSTSAPFNQMASWMPVRKKLVRPIMSSRRSPSGKYTIEQLLNSFEQQIVQGLGQIVMSTHGIFSLSLSCLLGTRIPKAPVLPSVAQHRRQENPIGVFDSKHCVTPDAIGVNDDLLEESFICSITPIDDRPSVPNTRSILPEYSATAAPAPSLLLMNYQYSPGILRRPSDQPHILGSHRVVSIPSKFRFHWLALAFDLTSLVLVDTFSFQSNGC